MQRQPGKGKGNLVGHQEESEQQASVLSSVLKSLPELESFDLTAWWMQPEALQVGLLALCQLHL